MPRNVIRFLFIAIVLMTLGNNVIGQITPNAADVMRGRISRAKALIAMRNHTAAVFELENLRRETNDPSVLNVVNVLLMNCFIEQGDHRKASELLNGFYEGARASRLNASSNYFAVAGQAVKSSRDQSDRYKSLGLLLSDPNLPPDAVADLDRMRNILETIITQSRTLGADSNLNITAMALLEDATNARALLARDDFDSRRWSEEKADARDKLANSGRPVLDATQTPSVIGQNNPPSNAPVQAPQRGGRQRVISDSIPTNKSVTSVGSLLDRATQKVEAVYPSDARSSGVEGTVKVNLVVDERGEVVEIESAEGPVLLQKAARDAAMKWKFRPYFLDGKPILVVGYVTFKFSL